MVFDIDFTQKINDHEPFTFVKIGDGELNCMSGQDGTNCDQDDYASKTQQLITAYNYLILQDDIYLGKWRTIPTDHTLKYVDYHCFIMDKTLSNSSMIIERYRAIKESKLPKILISNYLLERALILLNIDHHVVVPLQNWFLDYHKYKTQVVEIIKQIPSL